MGEKFLDKVYTTKDADGTRKLYDAWAESYEDEVGAEGYATPRRCAEALAAHMADLSAPVLDFGCGTGLSGVALRAAGFTTIDGVDLSPDMLAQARAKGIYRDLKRVEAGAALPFAPGTHAAVSAIGVIGAGAAPIGVFDTLIGALEPGGRFVFSFNDHTLEDPAFEGKVSDWVDAGGARLLFKEYGDHLPGMGLKSNVYVLEKT